MKFGARQCFYTCLSCCSWGMCIQGGMCRGGYARWWGPCKAGGMHGSGWCGWQGGMCGRGMHGRSMHGGGHTWQGACIAGGVWQEGHAHDPYLPWQEACMAGGGGMQEIWRLKQAVCILLKCILFLFNFYSYNFVIISQLFIYLKN